MADIHLEKKKRVRGSISKQQGYNPCLHKSSPGGLFHGQLGFNMVPSFGSSRWAAKRRVNPLLPRVSWRLAPSWRG